MTQELTIIKPPGELTDFELDHELRELDIEIDSKIKRYGMLLIEKRDRLPRGQFIPWVERNLPFGRRQAYRYMELAEDETGTKTLSSLTNTSRFVSSKTQIDTITNPQEHTLTHQIPATPLSVELPGLRVLGWIDTFNNRMKAVMGDADKLTVEDKLAIAHHCGLTIETLRELMRELQVRPMLVVKGETQ